MHDARRIAAAILQFSQMVESQKAVVLERASDVAQTLMLDQDLEWDKYEKLLSSLGMEKINLDETVKAGISSVYDDDLDDPIGLFGPSRY